jgi:hypothetical protein
MNLIFWLHLIVPFCRLSITNSSFIPSIVKEWNKLDIAIRKLDSLSKFKNAIRINSQSNKIFRLNFNFRNIPQCLVIFVIIFSKCSFHFAFWERITPRCLWLVDKGILLQVSNLSQLVYPKGRYCAPHVSNIHKWYRRKTYIVE